MENTSGQGKSAVVPAEVDRWNWGAFVLNWIWGLAHNVPMALLMFAPCVNFAMPFVLGLRGSAWAWRSRRWESIEQFKATQRVWGLAGFALLVSAVIFAVGLVLAVGFGMKQSAVYELSYEQLGHDPVATRLLGTPIHTGMVRGSISTAGPAGNAEISYSVTGPHAKGTLYTKATKSLGRWHIDAMELEVDGSPTRVPLLPPLVPAPSLPGKATGS